MAIEASALELIEQGLTQKQVCQDLGMSQSALQSWVNEAPARNLSTPERSLHTF